jgi:hypothetical protein
MKEKLDYAAEVSGGRPGPYGTISTLLRAMAVIPVPTVPSGFTPLAPLIVRSEPKNILSLSCTTGLPGCLSFTILVAFWAAVNWPGTGLAKVFSMSKANRSRPGVRKFLSGQFVSKFPS